MFLLVFVHGYNLNQGYLQPFTLPHEPLTLTSFTEYWLANGIFRFRIPMLFIISGYLFAVGDNKPHKQRISKRVKTLLWPYLFWSAFALLLTYVLEMFTCGNHVVAATQLMQIGPDKVLLHQYRWYEILARWIFFPVAYQLWFVRVLLVYNIAYPALRWCVTHQTAKWVFFSIAVLLWLSTAGFILFEGEGLLFFSLGVWMQKTNFNIDQPNKWLNPTFWLMVFIGLSIFKTWLAFQPEFKGIYPILSLLHKLVIFSGLACAWFGSNKLVKWCMAKRWFVWVSAFSFMIYVLHAPMVVYATKAAFLSIRHFYGFRMVVFIVLPLCLVALSILIGALLRKFSPKVYGLLTGGRGF